MIQLMKFALFCFESKWKKENSTLKSYINTGFYNKNTIEFELWGSDFNGAFNLNPRNILNLILRTNHLMFIPRDINKFLKLSIVSWLGIISPLVTLSKNSFAANDFVFFVPSYLLKSFSLSLLDTNDSVVALLSPLTSCSFSGFFKFTKKQCFHLIKMFFESSIYAQKTLEYHDPIQF